MNTVAFLFRRMALPMAIVLLFIGFSFALALHEARAAGPQCNSSGENVLQNPSFELPTVSKKNTFGWEVFDNGTSGLGWDVAWRDSFAGVPELAKLELHRSVNGWTHADGAQHAELDADWEGPISATTSEEASTVISQSVSTVPGVEYTLSWAFSPRPDTGADDNILEVLVDGTLKHTNSAAGGSAVDWQSDSITFIATNTETEISFRDGGTPDSKGTLLDDTSLTCEESVIEEPIHATGTIVIEKQVTEGSNLETLFDFTSDYAGDFSLWSNDATSTVVATGTYSVSETVPKGWVLDSAECVYGDESTSTPDSIEVDAGETVACVFINTEDGSSDIDQELSCSLDISRSTVNRGSTVTLDWGSTNAASATLTGFGDVATSGATTTSANSKTTFTLTVSDEQASSTCTTTVTIAPRRGGSGESISLGDGDDDNDGNNTDEGGTDSDENSSDGPEPEVLGEQVSAVPISAPATGAGGAARTHPLASLGALLGMLLGFGMLRVTRHEYRADN